MQCIYHLNCQQLSCIGPGKWKQSLSRPRGRRPRAQKVPISAEPPAYSRNFPRRLAGAPRVTPVVYAMPQKVPLLPLKRKVDRGFHPVSPRPCLRKEATVRGAAGSTTRRNMSPPVGWLDGFLADHLCRLFGGFFRPFCGRCGLRCRRLFFVLARPMWLPQADASKAASARMCMHARVPVWPMTSFLLSFWFLVFLPTTHFVAASLALPCFTHTHTHILRWVTAEFHRVGNLSLD